MGKPFFITTAIDYTNGAPHIGHAYEKVLADVLARYHRLKGDDVFYPHRRRSARAEGPAVAEKHGRRAAGVRRWITAKFVALWDKLDVRNTDAWAATTDPRAQGMRARQSSRKLWDDKDPATGESRWIYKKTQRGFYSVRQEQFLTDKERGPDGEFGPEWGVVEERDEENFYFRLTQAIPRPACPAATRSSGCSTSSTSAAPRGSPFVIPDFRVAELRNAVEKLEGDLCISRPAVAAEVGHPLPRELRRGLRHLRLVRRAGELHQLRPRPRPATTPAHRRVEEASPDRRHRPSPTGGRRSTSSARTSSSPRTASIGRSC